MDYAEWLAAYRRAVGDNDAARDYIDDLLIERRQLQERIRQLEAEREQWQRQAMSHG